MQLFRLSYAGWVERRGYALPSESNGHPEPALDEPTSWDSLAPFLRTSGSNSFVRNVIRAVTELYGNGEATITRHNWADFDENVRRHHREADWCNRVIQRAHIERLITGPYSDPLLDARKTLGANYDSVLRINAFACGWHPDSCDRFGNSARSLLAPLGIQPTTFDDYLAALDDLVGGCHRPYLARSLVGSAVQNFISRFRVADEKLLDLCAQPFGAEFAIQRVLTKSFQLEESAVS